MAVHIQLAETDADIDRCHEVMAQLRPRVQPAEFTARVRRQMATGFQLAFLAVDGAVCAVAGFRLNENLAWGRHLYVDDLATDAEQRGRGRGGLLFDWLVEFARQAGCEQLHLDSGVQRFDAHRFYLQKRMQITSHHFALALS